MITKVLTKEDKLVEITKFKKIKKGGLFSLRPSTEADVLEIIKKNGGLGLFKKLDKSDAGGRNCQSFNRGKRYKLGDEVTVVLHVPSSW